MTTFLFVIITVLAVAFGIGSFWLNSERKKNDRLEEENKRLEERLTVSETVQEKTVEQEKKNEEDKRSVAGNDLDSFNAGLDVLHKLAEKGRERNR